MSSPKLQFAAFRRWVKGEDSFSKATTATAGTSPEWVSASEASRAISDWMCAGKEACRPSGWNSKNYNTQNPTSHSGTIIWIEFGLPQYKEKFGMHKGLLCYHISHSKAMLIGPWSQILKTHQVLSHSKMSPLMFGRSSYKSAFPHLCLLRFNVILKTTHFLHKSQ